MKRTVPAVSFTTSHRALMIRLSKTMLSEDSHHHLHHRERFRAAWDDIPTFTLGYSNKQQWEHVWKMRYFFGLRASRYFSKGKSCLVPLLSLTSLYLFFRVPFYTFCYLPYYQTWPDFAKRENARAYAQSFGYDVWCPDGKFVRPYFHINAPMFTMTLEDL